MALAGAMIEDQQAVTEQLEALCEWLPPCFTPGDGPPPQVAVPAWRLVFVVVADHGPTGGSPMWHRYSFDFEATYRVAGLPFGVGSRTAYVEVDADVLRVRARG